MDRIEYVGLIFDCPYGDCMKNCPLLNIRNLPKDKAFKLWDELDHETLLQIINQHRNCGKERTKKWQKKL